MPKSKAADKKIEKDPLEKTEVAEKIIEIDEEEELEDELADGEDILGDSEDEEALDEEEVDPFKDKWEE